MWHGSTLDPMNLHVVHREVKYQAHPISVDYYVDFFDAQQGCKGATLVESGPNLDGPDQKWKLGCAIFWFRLGLRLNFETHLEIGLSLASSTWIFSTKKKKYLNFNYVPD